MTVPPDVPAPSRPLACRVCRRELPPEVAVTGEAEENVRHFCGLDCYRAWLAGRAAPDRGAASPGPAGAPSAVPGGKPELTS